MAGRHGRTVNASAEGANVSVSVSWRRSVVPAHLLIKPAGWASSAGQERRSLSWGPNHQSQKLNKPELTPDSLIPHLPAYRSPGVVNLPE
jgi:hypothetical protein